MSLQMEKCAHLVLELDHVRLSYTFIRARVVHGPSANVASLMHSSVQGPESTCCKLLQHLFLIGFIRADKGRRPILCRQVYISTMLQELTAGAFRTLNTAVHQTG